MFMWLIWTYSKKHLHTHANYRFLLFKGTQGSLHTLRLTRSCPHCPVDLWEMWVPVPWPCDGTPCSTLGDLAHTRRLSCTHSNKAIIRRNMSCHTKDMRSTGCPWGWLAKSCQTITAANKPPHPPPTENQFQSTWRRNIIKCQVHRGPRPCAAAKNYSWQPLGHLIKCEKRVQEVRRGGDSDEKE